MLRNIGQHGKNCFLLKVFLLSFYDNHGKKHRKKGIKSRIYEIRFVLNQHIVIWTLQCFGSLALKLLNIFADHLMGLKARAADGQTLPGLICPLCGKHTVKSYSVWKKNNAPAKILHLFKDGVTVIRACRKCVPYPINREREKRKGENKPASQSTALNAVKCDKPANAAKPLMNGYAKKTTNGKNSVLVSKGNGEVLKVNNSVMTNSTVVKEQVVTKANKDREVSAKNKRNGEDVEVDNLKKKAKIEEKKRTIEEVSGQELTGLECFESLQSEERIDSAGGQDAESFLLCNETRRDPEATRNGEASARVTRGKKWFLVLYVTNV